MEFLQMFLLVISLAASGNHNLKGTNSIVPVSKMNRNLKGTDGVLPSRRKDEMASRARIAHT